MTADDAGGTGTPGTATGATPAGDAAPGDVAPGDDAPGHDAAGEAAAGDTAAGDTAVGDTAAGEAGTWSPVFRVMDVMDVHHDLPATYPVISLQEVEPPLRHLTFPVGLPEATSLAYALRRIDTPRPLTHALLVDVLARFHVDVVAVRLVGRTGGTYLAELDLIGAKGREVVSCRPTDGLAVALRMPVPAPILCDERLLEGSGDVEPG